MRENRLTFLIFTGNWLRVSVGGRLVCHGIAEAMEISVRSANLGGCLQRDRQLEGLSESIYSSLPDV